MTSEAPSEETVRVWGVPLRPVTLEGTLQAVSALIEKNDPAFFITANTHYLMLSEQDPELRALNERAAFIVADGAPVVWAARRAARPLPERVAGSDLIFELSRLAAESGYRVFFAGGAPGVADEASRRLAERYPGLQVVGTASPSFRDGARTDLEALKARLDETRPHLLIVAATMPLGERWLGAHARELGVPVAVNLGAAIDFAAGRIRRAPVWMQKSGLEWAFRLSLEPRRLYARYARNAWFIARMLLRGRKADRDGSVPPAGPPAQADLSSS